MTPILMPLLFGLLTLSPAPGEPPATGELFPGQMTAKQVADDAGRDERGPRRGRETPPRSLTPEQLDQAIQIIDQINPRLAQSLRETRRQNGQQDTIRRIAQEFPNIYQLLHMQAESPQRFELHVRSLEVMRETWPLVRRLRQAREEGDAAAAQDLETQVREKIEAMFDIRMALRRLALEDLRRRVADLEGQLAGDEARRDEVIAQRMERVLNGRPGPGRGEGDRGDRRRGPRHEAPHRPDTPEENE